MSSELCCFSVTSHIILISGEQIYEFKLENILDYCVYSNVRNEIPIK